MPTKPFLKEEKFGWSKCLFLKDFSLVFTWCNHPLFSLSFSYQGEWNELRCSSRRNMDERKYQNKDQAREVSIREVTEILLSCNENNDSTKEKKKSLLDKTQLVITVYLNTTIKSYRSKLSLLSFISIPGSVHDLTSPYPLPPSPFHI